jgi:very-short-patch-repair endonuclease
VPQDVRERKGSFFTPKQWVELSQEYLAQTLGEDWQDNYYIWDCCAGTGNLLVGLTNPANIWASTLDKADVDVMHERIRNGARLFDNHIFQFDFLNDDFSKLPSELQAIINNPNKRRKLVIYINPPYAEAGTATQVTGSGANKTGVSNNTMIWQRYKDRFGLGIRELYVQFFIRIYDEIQGSTLAEFSKLKILQGSAFADFRSFFRATLLSAFVVPANTFDNVKGQFPIGFFIWNTQGTQSSSSAGYIGARALSATHSETRVTNSPAPLAGRGIQGAGKEKEQQRTINWGHNQNPQPKIMNNSEMREYRRELRKHGTPAEGALWNKLKAKQVAGLQFRRQFSVGQYILDFYCPTLRLAVELDGDYHYHWMQPKLDYERERILWEQYNIRVIRFENKVVFQNPQAIVDAILKHKEVMDYAQEDGEYLKWLAEEYHSTASSATSDVCTATPLTSIAPPPNPLPASGVGELITSDYTDTIGIPKGYNSNPLPMGYPCATLGQPMCRFVVDVYNHKGDYKGKKTITSESDHDRKITSWISSFGVKETTDVIGFTGNTGPDFQHNQYLYIAMTQGLLKNGRPNNETKYSITKQNLIPICVYFAVRLCQEATWLNDRDQFLYPNDQWQEDKSFQLDCLVYTLFHGQNRISMRTGTSALQANHWLPFYEHELGITEGFASHFMQDFLRDFRAGKVVVHVSKRAAEQDLFTDQSKHLEMSATTTANEDTCAPKACAPISYSPEVQSVMDAGREIYRYYHATRKQRNTGELNASLYDIKLYFKGKNDKGNMNATSDDEHFNTLMENLRIALQALAKHIEPKVYQYGFLK